MLIVMHHHATTDQIRAVREAVEAMGLRAMFAFLQSRYPR